MYFSACIPALFSHMPAHEAVERAASTGVKAFELWGWWDLDLERLRDAQQRTGLKCSAVCTRFIPLNVPHRREEYLSGLAETIEAARSLGCQTIISQVGQTVDGVSREAQHEAIVEGLRACVPMLEEAGMQLVIEPLNTLVDHKGYYLSSSDEGLDIVSEVGSPWVRLLFDVYHQQIMEGNLLSRLEAGLELIGHIHVAGVPGRHEILRESEIHYPTILSKLMKLGYQGAIGLEYFPVEEPEKGLQEILSLSL